jgi:hypothetical protein
MTVSFVKDPDAVLDYKFDWAPLTHGSGGSDWLAASEVITSFAVMADSGITVNSSSATDANTSVTVWLSGGTDGSDYNVTCHITTSLGRQDERSMSIVVRNR